MAEFNQEFHKIIYLEGGYVNDKDDAGGETYLGISRKHNPYWKGWTIIDDVKKQHGRKGLTNILKENHELTRSAQLYYKMYYWDVIELDDIPSQKIAHQLFDTCVNMGLKSAISIAQTVIGMTPTGKWSRELKYNLMKYEG